MADGMRSAFQKVADAWESPIAQRISDVMRRRNQEDLQNAVADAKAALDQTLAINAGASRKELVDAMSGHILAQGELVGTFAR